MRITYIYHSGFCIEAAQANLLIDYYQDGGPKATQVIRRLLSQDKPLYVLVSHAHRDHYNSVVLQWQQQKDNIIYLFSDDIPVQAGMPKSMVFLRKGDLYQNDGLRIMACGSTDQGISFLIHLEGKTLFHAGDLNNWHWQDESTPEEVREAEAHYQTELTYIRQYADHLDLAMFPVDSRIGSDFDRGARQFLAAIPTDMFIPMHFWRKPLRTEPFGRYAESHGTHFILLREPGEQVEV